MKKFLVLFIFLLSLSFLVACDKPDPTKQPDPTSSQGETDPTTPNPTIPQQGFVYDFSQTRQQSATIRVWLDDTDGFYMDELIAEFNKIHPNIVVEFTHMGTVDARERLELYGKAGRGADIIQFPHDHLAPALLSDLLFPLPRQFANNLKERMSDVSMGIATACFNPTTRSFLCDDNTSMEVFGAPIAVESVALFYNKDILDELGLEVAETFEELIAQAEAHSNIADAKYFFNTNYNDSYFMHFALTAFGYDAFGPNHNDRNNVGLDSPEVIAGLTWIDQNLKPLYRAGSTAEGIQGRAHTAFEAGELAYIITGPWMIETFTNLGLNFGVTTIPTINIDGEDVAPKTFAGAQIVSVYKYSENIEAALTFLEFMTSDVGLEIQYRHKGRLAALKEELLVNIPGLADDVYLQGIKAQLNNAVPMPTIPEVVHYWEPVRVMLNDVWNGTHTPEQAAARAERAYITRRDMR